MRLARRLATTEGSPKSDKGSRDATPPGVCPSRKGSELVAETEPNLVAVQLVLVGLATETEVRVAVVLILVLEASGHVLGDCTLDTGTCRPADTGNAVRSTVGGRIDVGDRETTGTVDQEAVEGPTARARTVLFQLLEVL